MRCFPHVAYIAKYITVKSFGVWPHQQADNWKLVLYL